jgi:hypothetical protein
MSFGYIFLIIYCISICTIGITWAISDYAFKKIDLLTHAKSYSAQVVDFDKKETEDSEGTTTSYYPILRFTTETGETVTMPSDEAEMSHELNIGERRTVYYYAEKGKLTTIGAMTYVSIIGLLIMFLCLETVFVGILMYSFGCKMDKFYHFVRIAGMNFFAPFLMIAFDVLLIYAFFYGDTSGGWFIKPLLIVFILGVTFGIWGYITIIRQKGAPKFKQISPTQWVGDWEDEK